MTFFPAWQTAAPVAAPGFTEYGTSAFFPYWEIVGLIALGLLTLVAPFLSGRFWGVNSELPRGERARQTMFLAMAIGLPFFMIAGITLRGNPIPVTVIGVHLAGAGFLLGRWRGRYEIGLLDSEDFPPL
jgi:hypothetical protein